MKRMRKSGSGIESVVLAILIALGMVAGLTSCGDSGSSTGGGSKPSPTTVISLHLSPLNPSAPVGSSEQFFATATYGDQSTKDVTTLATWTSSDTSTATVGSQGDLHPGRATAVALGSATITVAFGEKTQRSTLTVASNADRVPLIDLLGSQRYLGFPGGLYENASDVMPADHNARGLTAAGSIRPLDSNGNPNTSGKVVFVSIGRSTEQDEFSAFASQASTTSGVNHTSLVLANGASSGVGPCYWTLASGAPPCEPVQGNQYDRIRDSVLTPLGVGEKQVQVAWIEIYNADPAADGFQALCDKTVSGCTDDVTHSEMVRMEQQVGQILRAAKIRWPNLKEAFLSSRLYAGYETSNHAPEPYSYEYGFSVKAVVEAQVVQMRSGGATVDPVAGNLNSSAGVAPWIAWAPYVWANGDTPRSDGFIWCNGQTSSPCNGEVDFQYDGIHGTSVGYGKISDLFMSFFLSSPYTPWFRP